MTNSPSLDRLKQAVALKEQIAAPETQLADIWGGTAETPATPSPVPRSRGRPPGKQGMSEEGRARIAAAQKARWAKFHASSGAGPKQKKQGQVKGPISPEGMARIIAAQKARWARFHASKDAAFRPARQKKRSISPIHRARLAAAQKVRTAA